MTERADPADQVDPADSADRVDRADRPDPFGTAGLRAAVLAGWRAAPARFREDANAEEALALGGYADRVLVELIANGVDAARTAAVPADVLVRWVIGPAGTELRVANTGAPLTAAGVSALATLRASAKRAAGDTVGHFGVGFTAVRAVADTARVVSAGAGISFDRNATAAAVAALGAAELDAEMAARHGQVPALRLPWPLDPAEDAELPAGYPTEVRVPVRPAARAGLLELLEAVGDDLFFALPGLRVLRVELPGRARTVRRRDEGNLTVLAEAVSPPERTFRVVTAAGELPVALLADRPVEERHRRSYWISWVLPVDGPARAGDSRVGAPTATDEPLSLPADLYGTFPVDDTRRRLAAGPLTDHLLDRAATAYRDLVAAVPADDRIELIPAGGFPAGPIDARLRAGIIAELSVAPVWRNALDEPVAATDAALVPGLPTDAAPLLAQALPGLLASPPNRAAEAALRSLGVATVPLEEAVSALAGISRPPEFWHALYAALDGLPTDALGGLPVPLVGGGQRSGARGALLPTPDGPDADLLRRAAAVAPNLPVVEPAAAHPLLARLGATPADAAALLTAPALVHRYAAVRADLEDTDPDPAEVDELARLALDLIGDAGGIGVGAGDLADQAGSGSVLAELILTDADGAPWPAAELLFPGAELAGVLAEDADLPPVGPDWVAGYPESVLAAAGVRTGLRVLTVDLASAATENDSALEAFPDVAAWQDEAGGPGLDPTFTALADLDLIDDAAWPRVLTMIAADRRAWQTLTPAGGYTSWWLRHFAEIDGRPLGSFRRFDASELTGLLDPLPVGVDPGVAAAIGIPATLADLVRDDPALLLRRYADPARVVPAVAVAALTAAVIAALQADPDLSLPDRVRVCSGAAVDGADAVVLDLPWWASLLGPDEVVPGGAAPDRVAELLDLGRASEQVPAELVESASAPVGAEIADRIRAATTTLGLDEPAVALTVRPGLAVRTDDGEVPVSWWIRGDETFTDGSAAGIGRALAWRAGRWTDRQLAVAAAAGDRVTLVEAGSDAAPGAVND